MKRSIQLSLFFLAFLLTGCELIGDIFAAGVYTGIFFVVLIIVVILVVIFKIFRR